MLVLMYTHTHVCIHMHSHTSGLLISGCCISGPCATVDIDSSSTDTNATAEVNQGAGNAWYIHVYALTLCAPYRITEIVACMCSLSHALCLPAHARAPATRSSIKRVGLLELSKGS